VVAVLEAILDGDFDAVLGGLMNIRYFVMIGAMLAGACASQSSSNNSQRAGAQAGPTLHVLDCGDVRLADKSLMSPGVDQGRVLDLKDTCYLVVHPRGTLLWDTGLPDALVSMPEGFSQGPFTMRRSKTLLSQLTQLGHAPATITYLAISHLHGDHAGNANMFARSTWLIQKPEHEVAFSDQAAANGFDPSQYDSLRNAKTTLLTGDHDVFGDGTVRIMTAPGHTIGHQVLLLRLPQTGAVMLSGDLWHFRENRERRGVPSFNWSKEITLASMDRIEGVIANNNARLIIQHDPQDIAALGPLPAVLR
jgi:N-acyl homoserine lactone hydrolase